jgi:SAM-dependent methyltransferase
MAYDPVEWSQRSLRSAAHLLHSKGLLTVPTSPKAPSLGEEERKRFFDSGRRQLARLAKEIETNTGCKLESRRALDFGCGVGRLALPMAERCEYVYGLDVSLPALREAAQHAKRVNLSNVEFIEASRLSELSGRYDLVQSLLVFQHIPSREGERIFATLVRGLRPGGVGAIQVTLRPSRPLGGLLRSTSASLSRGGNRANPTWRRRLSYPYMLIHSYSLNRLAELLADAGVTEWHARWGHERGGSHEAVTIIFRKADENVNGQGSAGEASDVLAAKPAQPGDARGGRAQSPPALSGDPE